MTKTFHELCDELKKNVETCSVNDVKKMKESKEDFLLVDIREDNEFNAGSIKGSVHIGKELLKGIFIFL